tara:strand:+ start:90 stop:704 length:615 start_codon:yes stop_codon:yes gene_type:complete
MKKETNLKPDINEISKINIESNNDKFVILKENEEFLKSLEKVSHSLDPLLRVNQQMNDLIFHLKYEVEPNLSRLQRVCSDNTEHRFRDLRDDYKINKKQEEIPLFESLEEYCRHTNECEIQNPNDLFQTFDDQISGPYKRKISDKIYEQRLEMNLTVREEFKNKVGHLRMCISELFKMKKTQSRLLSQVKKQLERYEENNHRLL